MRVNNFFSSSTDGAKPERVSVGHECRGSQLAFATHATPFNYLSP
jgi:hypothetical protein